MLQIKITRGVRIIVNQEELFPWIKETDSKSNLNIFFLFAREKKPEYRGPKKIIDEEDDDFGPQRLSRISKRNVEIEKKLKKKEVEEEEPGFFEKILVGLGCISRDQQKK